jgi:transcriptional regulator with XRE-family HTH domain
MPKKRKDERGIRVDAEKLDRLRKQAGMKQVELAEAASVDPKTIQRAESGEPISLSNLRRISDALGLQHLAQLLPDGPVIEPVAATKKKALVKFAGTTEVPVELIEVFRRERFAFRFFLGLQIQGLISDGVFDVNLSPGSVIVSGVLTRRDARRVVNAFIAGELDDMKLTSVSLSKALPVGLPHTKMIAISDREPDPIGDDDVFNTELHLADEVAIKTVDERSRFMDTLRQAFTNPEGIVL